MKRTTPRSHQKKIDLNQSTLHLPESFDSSIKGSFRVFQNHRKQAKINSILFKDPHFFYFKKACQKARKAPNICWVRLMYNIENACIGLVWISVCNLSKISKKVLSIIISKNVGSFTSKQVSWFNSRIMQTKMPKSMKSPYTFRTVFD